MTGADLSLAGDELDLDGEDYAAARREAGIRLAGAGRDEDAAAVLLRPALEAIGAVPYQRARPKYHYGEAR